MNFSTPFYLCSKSPRRRELLQQMGITYEIIDVEVDEVFPPDCAPIATVEHLAMLKLRAIPFAQYPTHAIFMTCDTIVVVDGIILGKPANEAEAIEMLTLLSGKTHEVITAIALCVNGEQVVKHSTTQVTFKSFSPKEMEYYVAHCEPYDKAGGYGIQEWIGLVGVTNMKGSYFNVVGLPTDLLWQMLMEHTL